MKLTIRQLLPLILVLFLIALVQAGEIRTWTDATGKFTLEAEFVELRGESVVLLGKDGKQRIIPLKALSEADQAIAQKMSVPAENPFKVVGSSEQEPRVLEVAWDGAEVSMADAGNRWQVVVKDVAPLDFEPKPTRLPKKRDFFEKGTSTVISTIAGRGLVSYSLGNIGRNRNQPPSSRVVWFDIKSGKVLANAVVEGKWVAKAIHDDGQRFLLANGDEKQAGELATCTAENEELRIIDKWTPYSKHEGKSRGVRYAEFAYGNQLVTCNEPGSVAVWDFEKREQICNFRIGRTSIPAVSPDRRTIGYAGGGKVGMFSLESLEPVGFQGAEQMDFWVRGVFSPSGKRFAAASHHALTVWNVADGEQLFHGKIPGLNTAFGIEFPAEDYVMIAKEYLVEFASGIKVWQYARGGSPICKSGYTFFGADSTIVPTQLPHPEAVRLLDEAKKQADLFVIKKGAKVAVDLTDVPAAYREQVEKGVKQQLAKVDCEVVASAPVMVKAKITGPHKDKVSYFRLGSFDFQKYVSTLTYEYEGKSIWASSRTNVPGMLREQRDKSYQQMIDEAAAKPNLHFFQSINLPEYLQKPSGTRPGRPSQGQQTIGVTTVTAQGV